MAVKKHQSIHGAWLIDWWVANTDKPKNPKTGKHPLRRRFETHIGSYESACSRWSDLCQQHKTTHIIGNPRIDDIYPDYLSYIELNRSKGYYKSICAAQKRIKPFFGRSPVSHISQEMIEDFKRHHRDTPAFTNQCLKYLGIMIRWAVSQKKAQPLPFKITYLPHREKMPQPPSPAEFQTIMATVRENFKKSGTNHEQRAIIEAAILLIYATGLRWDEAKNLLWENLRWEDGRCLASTTKTGVPRYCIFPKETLDLLAPYRYSNKENKRPKRGYIFTNPATGKPYTTIRRTLKNAAEQHSIPIRGPHDLRHAVGTDIIEATGDIRAAQEILGHASLKSTQRYTHVAIKRQQRINEITAQFRKEQRQEERNMKKSSK